MQWKQTLIGILLLSLVFVPHPVMAGLDDGSLNSTSQRTPVHRETDADSDQRFLAAFLAAPISFREAIGITERLHTGSRAAAISFDISDNPSYRVRTVKDKEIWENVVDVRTGLIAGPETSWTLNELETEERDNINALRSVKQELSDAVAIAEKAAAGKAISGGLVKEGDQLNFVVVVLSDDHVKEVFLEPPRATSKSRPAISRRN
jgi:uncharacterized membrane protein YkoI